jgi:hypothetical protein
MRRLARAMMWMACGLMATGLAFAQKSALPACTFNSVTYQEGTDPRSKELVPTITVLIGQAPAPVGQPAPSDKNGDWEVMDATDGSALHLKATSSLAGYDIQPSPFLDPNHNYFLTVLGFPGCDPDNPPLAVIKVKVAPSTPLVPSAHKPAPKGFGLSESKTRTDSDIYLSGLLTGSTGQKAAYTADIKTQLNYIVRQAHDSHPEFAVLPSFDFTASTNTKQDGNSVTFGIAVRYAWAKQVAPLSALDLHTVLEPGGAVQADPYFRLIEPVFRLPIYGLPNALQWGPVVAYLLPMFGTEAGESTKVPSPSDYANVPATLPRTRGIFRLFAGGSLLINVNKQSKTASGTKTIFSVETDYINRWPMTAEPLFSQGSTGKLTLLGIGTQPRGYVTTKIARNIGSYFSIALQHDYGELPPLYTKVDNKYSISLTYKASLKAGAK